LIVPRRNRLRIVALEILLLGTAFALATALAGWWAVPVLAAIWGLIAPNRKRAPLLAAVAAVWGWVLLLLWMWIQGPVMTVAERTGSVLRVGSASLLGITLAFSLVLAWAAAVIAGALRSPGNES
jgi:hypothetical protein